MNFTHCLRLQKADRIVGIVHYGRRDSASSTDPPTMPNVQLSARRAEVTGVASTLQFQRALRRLSSQADRRCAQANGYASAVRAHSRFTESPSKMSTTSPLAKPVIHVGHILW